MRTVVGMLRRWVTQDVARTNAAQAAVRLQHRRRQIEDVDAFLAAYHHQSHHSRTGELSTRSAHGQTRWTGPT
jgi:hypothetical protein